MDWSLLSLANIDKLFNRGIDRQNESSFILVCCLVKLLPIISLYLRCVINGQSNN